jgi:hypothetical protein
MNVIDITTSPVEDTTPIGDNGVHHLSFADCPHDHRICDGSTLKRPNECPPWDFVSAVCRCGALICIPCMERQYPCPHCP